MAFDVKFCKLGKNAEEIFKELKQNAINESGNCSGIALKSGVKIVDCPEKFKNLNETTFNIQNKYELNNYIEDLLEEDSYGDKYGQIFALEFKNFKNDLNLYYFFGFLAN